MVVQAGGAGREGPVSRKVSVESKTDGGAAKVRMEVRGSEVRGAARRACPASSASLSPVAAVAPSVSMCTVRAGRRPSRSSAASTVAAALAADWSACRSEHAKALVYGLRLAACHKDNAMMSRALSLLPTSAPTPTGESSSMPSAFIVS